MNFKTIAEIDQEACIKCGLCYIACEDTSHQSIRKLKDNGHRRYEVIEEECVGCNLCMHVCPVDNCITMKRVDKGLPSVGWVDDPRNPQRRSATN
jgi:dihydropyrimidine dehydrogenase (NAD+) subunit PreA